MTEPLREDLQVQHRKAILVGIPDPTLDLSREHVLDELKGLARTAGVQVVGELVQMRQKPHPATVLGKGKLEELKQLVATSGAQAIIFDNNLTPSQGRHLEQETKCYIVDRSELILDIFATHARTYEARLQVELAQLQYMRSRLKRRWTHLERVDGAGIARGPGEKQIETDRRLIDARIDELRRRLREIEGRRERMVKQRDQYPLVSLVGYTNAGKSTLMRALTGADVYVADQLFATLDTRTRRWTVLGFGDVLLSDTVGFVRHLPHALVASFRSTLEEARHADLLLHVVDASHPEAEHQVHVVEQTLQEIGVIDRPTILVLNKLDAVRHHSTVAILRKEYPHTVSISARHGEGLTDLTRLVAELLGGGWLDIEVEAPVEEGRLFAFLAQHAEAAERAFHPERAVWRGRIPARWYRVLQQTWNGNIRVRVLSSNGNQHFAPLSTDV
ncbi:MAG: GTPase HflX [Planctomycetaceae bacterium]|nr:MAG: GTPase HflX [Planctomycetaceae bacterium]